ncbi:MAG TPA: class I SAM-dependent methyltransferase [Candidatus Binataceae bacterium]|nr:class I SAM-dependent methyltransferase [Candidatus Binataceae bacterium]
MPSESISSREELREQYKTPVNFNARVRLHGRFSTNRGGMFRFVFDQMKLPADARVLELGSGTALFWRGNQERIPTGWRITLSDYSAGMLDDVRRTVASIPHRFTFMQIDAQSLPFPDRSFDAVIANHMLYHVPDIARALNEIRRVLKPGSCCYAATMGLNNMREFDELAQRFLGISTNRAARRFGLETGLEHMQKVFPHVEVRKIDDALNVTEAQPLIDYIDSTRLGKLASEEQKRAFKAFAEAEIRAHGALHFKKDTGVLIATA